MYKVPLKIISVVFLLSLIGFSCKSKNSIAESSVTENSDLLSGEKKVNEGNIKVDNFVLTDSLSISRIHKPNFIVGDFDGDNRRDTVKMVVNNKNNKYGLKILFATGKTSYLGLGKDVIDQGFDDFEWVGIFEKVSKGEVHYNNVIEGEIISEEEVNKADLIKLLNDGIYVHAAESCGGGIIYLKNGIFEWIQQE